jgi:hypothetical protein
MAKGGYGLFVWVPNICQFNIVFVSRIFAPYRWWNVTPLMNMEDLNICCDSYVGIVEMDICVA